MPAPALEEQNTATSQPAQDFLLLVFIHGFKGTDETFGEFPKRLQHIVSESVDGVLVENITFPAYETKGDLTAAVIRFADWLTTLTVQRENEHGGGAGSAKIVLCGHSMGGFLAADSLLEFIRTSPEKDSPVWPKIIACLTFDTPFLGINPSVVKNSVTKVAEYADAAKTVGSAIFGSFAGLGVKKAADASTTPTNNSAPASSWSKWAPAAYAVGGALVAGAAAGGAYYKREDLNQGYSWATDHLKYVGNLWDEKGLRHRVDALVDVQEHRKVLFQNFYVHLPESLPTHLTPRTFIVLPKRTSPECKCFRAVKNGRAPDEIQGHTGMFSAKTNDGYYNLGLEAAQVIRQALQISHGIDTPEGTSSNNQSSSNPNEAGAGFTP